MGFKKIYPQIKSTLGDTGLYNGGIGPNNEELHGTMENEMETGGI